MVKVRVIGTREQVDSFINKLRKYFKVTTTSRRIPSRYRKDYVRVYLVIEDD